MAARRTSRRGDLGSLRHRFDHDSLERALAELTEEEPSQKPLLALGRAPEEVSERIASRGLRP